MKKKKVNAIRNILYHFARLMVKLSWKIESVDLGSWAIQLLEVEALVDDIPQEAFHWTLRPLRTWLYKIAREQT